MHKLEKNFIDVAIIGGGIFGAEIAIKAKSLGLSVKIIEQKSNILSGASANNQNRLHLGFHYPRDLNTGRQCIRGFDIFKKKYAKSIQENFLNAYFISNEGSLTSSDQFIKFCGSLGLPYQTIDPSNFPVEIRSVDLAISCDEVVYDCSILRDLVWENLKNAGVNVELQTKAKAISKYKDLFKIDCDQCGQILSNVVVNASYADINNLTSQLNYPIDKKLFEYTAVAILDLDIDPLGITIMDGPFLTLLPYGKTGKFLLYCVDLSVIQKEVRSVMDPLWYTPERAPFSLIDKELYFQKMISFCKRYVPILQNAKLSGFLEGPRMVLSNKDNTDERPSLINNFDNSYFTVFSGKIDHSIWVADEVEKSLKEKFSI